MIGITMATYRRADGSTPLFLKRALSSIVNQTFQDWKLFLIGDRYEDNAGLEEIAKIIPAEKLVLVNLNFAHERDVYTAPEQKTILWNTGGTYAVNYAINKAVSEGIYDLCHLDHDDYWMPTHLEDINKAMNSFQQKPAFLFTLSRFINNPVFPQFVPDGTIEPRMPAYAQLIHSSVCVDYKQLDLRYRNMYAEFGILFPSDGDMWERCREMMRAKNLTSYVIKKITCVHDLENH